MDLALWPVLSDLRGICAIGGRIAPTGLDLATARYAVQLAQGVSEW